jgi:hypothetical protein
VTGIQHCAGLVQPPNCDAMTAMPDLSGRFRGMVTGGFGSIAGSQLDHVLVAVSLNGEETPRGRPLRDRRPILSSRISAFQPVKWPYVGKILDTSEVCFGASSDTY